MILKSFVAQNFRNYVSLNVDWHTGINMIYGANAQGKTNLLEGIAFLSTLSSFRNSKKEEMIRMGADYFYLSGIYTKDEMNHEIKAAYSDKKKYILKLDGNNKHKLGDMIGSVNTVVFSPDDLFMMKGNPQERRSFLDREIIQMSPQSYDTFQRYQKTLRQRNNVLKTLREGKTSKELLKVFDLQLAEYGSMILWKRKEALDRLLPLVRLAHRKITDGNEELLMAYEGGISKYDALLYKKGQRQDWQKRYFDILEETAKEDILRGMTGFGPHRDDIHFYINGNHLKKYGSQGQQRTAVLALKISELELMKGQRGEYPIFLLDDVLSELDQNRREALLGVVNEKVQTFITGTKKQEFPWHCNYYKIEKGSLIKE